MKIKFDTNIFIPAYGIFVGYVTGNWDWFGISLSVFTGIYLLEWMIRITK